MSEKDKTVKGETSGVQGSVWGPTEPHTHRYYLTEAPAAIKAVRPVIGLTDGKDGHTHTISEEGRTNQADDGHYHLIPVTEVRVLDLGEFDIWKYLDGDNDLEDALIKWIDKRGE